MEDEATLIREQMLETRTALTEKLESLEEQVTAKVKDTTDSVVETVETVKDAVENTVHNVSDTVEKTVETVKDTFDMSRHFEEHPWVMLAVRFSSGTSAAGFLRTLAPRKTQRIESRRNPIGQRSRLTIRLRPLSRDRVGERNWSTLSVRRCPSSPDWRSA